MQDDSQNDQNLVQNPPQDASLPTQTQQTPQSVSLPAGRQGVSTPVKEVEPHAFDQGKPEGYIEVSEKEPQIRPEVEEAGVYKVSDKIKLDQEAKNAGLTEAKEAVPVSLEGGKVTLPLNAVQAKAASKGDTGNSITWLANLILIYLKKLGGPPEAR